MSKEKSMELQCIAKSQLIENTYKRVVATRRDGIIPISFRNLILLRLLNTIILKSNIDNAKFLNTQITCKYLSEDLIKDFV